MHLLSHCRCCIFNLLPPGRPKRGSVFGAKQQHKIMVPPTQVWTAWWRSCGLTCLAARGGLSEIEIVLLLRCSAQMVKWDGLGFSTQEKSLPFMLRKEHRLQTAWVLADSGVFFSRKRVSESVRYTPMPGVFLETKVILSIIGWFSSKSSFSFCD